MRTSVPGTATPSRFHAACPGGWLRLAGCKLSGSRVRFHFEVGHCAKWHPTQNRRGVDSFRQGLERCGAVGEGTRCMGVVDGRVRREGETPQDAAKAPGLATRSTPRQGATQAPAGTVTSDE